MPSPSPLSIDEQMRVLRGQDDLATWSLKHLGLPEEWRDTNEPGNTERCQEAVDRLFTLTREDIEKSLASQGLLPEALPSFYTKRGARDGSYFIEEGGRWRFYYQERECQWPEVTFDDLTEARKVLLNTWIPEWLDRLRVPCRTADHREIISL